MSGDDLPEASLYQMALVFAGSLHKYVCEGNSMRPTLADGEVVLVDRDSRVRVGDVVVARHPIEQNSEILKRIERIDEHGHFFIIGDNLDDSNDSRQFGAITRDYINGKVVARVR